MIVRPDVVPEVPPGFAPIPDGVLDAAFRAVVTALDFDVAVPRLRKYYSPSSDFAGATFVEALAGPNTSPNEFTAADLYAVTLLSVDPPGPYVTRRFLDPGETRNQLTRLLASLGDADDIALVDGESMIAMQEFYKTVKVTLGVDPWVTASKLCARKRPGLFPVRDELTRDLLGLLEHKNFQIDWQVFRAVMLPESGVVDTLHDLRRKVVEGQTRDLVAMDSYPLRWLDVALWMQAKTAKPHSHRR